MKKHNKKRDKPETKDSLTRFVYSAGNKNKDGSPESSGSRGD